VIRTAGAVPLAAVLRVGEAAVEDRVAAERVAAERVAAERSAVEWVAVPRVADGSSLGPAAALEPPGVLRPVSAVEVACTEVALRTSASMTRSRMANRTVKTPNVDGPGRYGRAVTSDRGT
jgi:hypothetical protein